MLLPWTASLAWVFPPFHLIGLVLQKILSESVHETLILPRWQKSWSPLLHALPIQAQVPLRGQPRCFDLGSLAPPMWQREVPPFRFMAYHICF